MKIYLLSSGAANSSCHPCLISTFEIARNFMLKPRFSISFFPVCLFLIYYAWHGNQVHSTIPCRLSWFSLVLFTKSSLLVRNNQFALSNIVSKVTVTIFSSMFSNLSGLRFLASSTFSKDSFFFWLESIELGQY